MSQKSPRRRSAGAVLLVVMTCLAIAMTLIVGWAKIALLESRQTRSVEDRVQTEWLAESAIGRAAAQLLANPDYQGETWRLTAADLGRGTAAAGKPAAALETKGDVETKPDAETKSDADTSPGADAKPPANDQPASREAGAEANVGAPVVAEVLITVEPVPDRAAARRVHVRADFPLGSAGTGPGTKTKRISKQTVFELSDATPK